MIPVRYLRICAPARVRIQNAQNGANARNPSFLPSSDKQPFRFHMMKRKADDSIDGADGEGSRKRTAIDNDTPNVEEKDHFCQSIFGKGELEQLQKQYQESKPYVFPNYRFVG